MSLHQAALIVASSGSPVTCGPTLGACKRSFDELDLPITVSLAVDARPTDTLPHPTGHSDDPLWCLTWRLGEGNATKIIQRTHAYTIHSAIPSSKAATAPLRRRSKMNVLANLSNVQLFELGEMTLKQRQELVRFAEGTSVFMFDGRFREPCDVRQSVSRTYNLRSGCTRAVGGKTDGCRMLKKRLLTHREWIELILFDAAAAGLVSAENVDRAIAWAYDICSM